MLAQLEQDQIKSVKDEKHRFVMMAVAMHPERADSLLKMLEEETKDPNEWAEPIPEDADFSEYVPVQQRPELSDILKDLQHYGMVIVEDDD